MTGRVLEQRYRIGPRIARGGMASVYEATDIRLDRIVAIKVMHSGLGDDDEFAARFVREARSAARLSHPNVVAVYDQGDDNGIVFLAMELIPGHTLRDVIRKESPMSPARALALVEPVLSALAAAHRAGLIHRDIKPENVLIADDGRVKVADFGLAKAVSTDTQLTATGGVLIGTVSYLAPELVVDGRADARADVYAAGVVLYELLTGARPHEGETPIQVAYKHVHEDVPPPSRLVPEIPAYVDALVARATARDRSLRPADASVLLHQVHRVTQALANGVRDDPELTADLLPMQRIAEDAASTHTDTDTDTASDPFDADEMAALTRPKLTGGAERGRLVSGGSTPGGSTAGGSTARRSTSRGSILLVLALLIAATAGVGAWWFGDARYTSTPGVIGLSQVAAEQKLQDVGLDVTYADEAYSETISAGLVLDTDPGAGSRILDGGTVEVTVSLGKERYDVPITRGLSEDAAQDALTKLKLSFNKSVQKFSETIPAGTVLGSDPKAGTTLRPGTAVDLFVSQGPRPIRFRDFTGQDAEKARTALEAKGLEVSFGSEEFSDSIPAGNVISQSPTSGPLFRGETVTLVVSKGPELVEVPGGLVASGVDAATEKLEALEFVVDIEKANSYLGLGYVLSVDPGSGSMVPRGSTITLYLI